MSTFDEQSSTAAHNACGDACRRLLSTDYKPEFSVERCWVNMDGCHFQLTIIAEFEETGAEP